MSVEFLADSPMMKIAPTFLIAIFLSFLSLLSLAADKAENFASLCADRTAIERIYHAHRLGTKQTFDEAMPREMGSARRNGTR